ncbi:regulator of polyketide synthase expression [Psychrobacillus glaciei]|uniref:Regulator of polyketide synthase expression n=1 Tax=Psychrobacillus glaciei TaxID=2283160 RepID=A0A5J6SMZ7_9BACI|nr:helix-turn-helix domain-containing protein [Psychrobacillus glaciei]QFF99159.1 regulator of polyketide synthase expression [Psychrobacillus glaciei]
MINHLRKIYPSLRIYIAGIDDLDSNYKWFTTDKNEIIGICEEELTAKDISLLTTFLLPHHIQFPIPTLEEKKWREVVYSSESNAHVEFKSSNSYRFVYFSIQKNQIDPILFKEVIQELFAKQVSILWENGHEGVIIEEQTIYEDSISFEQIIDILMSDLYVKINFFVGPFKKSLKDVAQHFQSLTNVAKKVFIYSNKTVVTYIDALPFLLINQTEPDLRTDISQTILQETLTDEETLKMIEVFFQCNLNISETSKFLHMHRNSLQYRLDRFFEKTGIDVRQFHHAMTVYLALLSRK